MQSQMTINRELRYNTFVNIPHLSNKKKNNELKINMVFIFSES